MAAKRNKSKKSSSIDKWQGLNLPPEIIQLLRSKTRTKPSPLHYVGLTCITKWWVPPQTRCIRTRYPEFTLLGISSNTSSASTHYQHFYGDFIIHNAAADCRQIMAYSTKENAWIGHECDPLDPFDTKKKCMEFTGLIGLILGKFGALNLQGAIAVVENIDSRLAVTGIHINKGAPSANWRLFREHLFEMSGELFLIFLIHKKSIEIVDHAEVFGLCLDELKWVKMERLQGKTVLLDGGCCCWVNSAEIGCRGDCVYFTQGEGNMWWTYDMQSSCISEIGSDFLLH